MKAIVQKKYGGPEVLHLEDVDTPIPQENEVLIKTHAAAINDYDWLIMSGRPYLYRLFFGILKPKKKILGMELSGIVEALGKSARKFKVGDAVYGDISEYGFGTFAEYICINEQALVHKPPKMSFAEAASISHASMLAVQGLIDVGNIQKHQKVLINGAGGGVGTLALYIAKLYNADVTGVDTGDKLKMMSSIGFDQVIDYKQEDFTKNGQCYDLILDMKTKRLPFDFIRSLSARGTYVTVGGNLSRLIQILVFKGLIKKMYKKRMSIVALKANKDLDYIHKLYESGNIKPVIDGPYKLSEAPELIQYFGEGKHTGKVVLSMER